MASLLPLYYFSTLCGGAFTGGSVTFDSDNLLYPVGGRIISTYLRGARTAAFACESCHTLQRIISSPTQPLALAIDEEGHGFCISLGTGVVLSRISFKNRVTAAAWSPCGRYVAIAVGRILRIWRCPAADTGWRLDLLTESRQHSANIKGVSFSSCGAWLLSCSRDLTIKLHAVDASRPSLTFVGLTHSVVQASFSSDGQHVFAIDQKGAVLHWRFVPDSLSAGKKGIAVDLRRKPKFPRVKVKEDVDAVNTTPDVQIKQEEPDAMEVERQRRELQGSWLFVSRSECGIEKYGKVVAADFHPATSTVVVGFERGVAGLWEIFPVFTPLATVSIGHGEAINQVAINNDGEWLALGCGECAQLVVWEWRSESFVLRQQAHRGGVRAVAVQPVADFGGIKDGSDRAMVNRSGVIVTGGDDGKVKFWDSDSGFNFASFDDHTSAVNALAFTPTGNAVLSASSDGSIRAYDLVRYRQFRVLTAGSDMEEFTQQAEQEKGKIIGNGVISDAAMIEFTSVAVDSTGHMVVAGSRGASFSAYVWSLETGRLLERLSGHEDAVTSIAFHPHPSKPGIIATGSLDKTVRVWDLYGRAKKGGASEALMCAKGVTAAVFDPRGNNVLAAALQCGEIWFYDTQNNSVIATIDGLRDIQAGRTKDSRIPMQGSSKMTRAEKKKHGSVGLNPLRHQHFSSLCYGPSGRWLVAASKNSPRVCMYDPSSRSLLSVVTLTRNFSIDGVFVELLNRRLTETGYSIDDFGLSDSNDDEAIADAKRRRQAHAMPGCVVAKQRSWKLWDVVIAQSGSHWFAATSEGLYVYALEDAGGAQPVGVQNSVQAFAPVLLTLHVTPQRIQEALKEKHFSKALVLALALNDKRLLMGVFQCVPYRATEVVVASVCAELLPALLNFLRVIATEAKEVQRVLRWSSAALSTPHMLQALRQGGSDLRPLTLLLLRAVQALQTKLQPLWLGNANMLEFVSRF